MADRLERWPIARVKPYEGNPRLHSPRQVNQIVAGILENSFGAPILVDRQGVIVAGHGRLLAAKKLGMRRVPVVVLAHLTEEQARAMRLADNRLAEEAAWDPGLTLKELSELDEAGYDTSVVGFTEDDVAALEAELELENEPETKRRGPKAGRILYMLEFDTEEQKEGWLAFAAWLRDRARGKSLGAAVVEHAAKAMKGAEA